MYSSGVITQISAKIAFCRIFISWSSFKYCVHSNCTTDPPNFDVIKYLNLLRGFSFMHSHQIVNFLFIMFYYNIHITPNYLILKTISTTLRMKLCVKCFIIGTLFYLFPLCWLLFVDLKNSLHERPHHSCLQYHLVHSF